MAHFHLTKIDYLHKNIELKISLEEKFLSYKIVLPYKCFK